MLNLFPVLRYLICLPIKWVLDGGPFHSSLFHGWKGSLIVISFCGTTNRQKCMPCFWFMKHLKGCWGEKKTKGSLLNKAGFSQALKANVRERGARKSEKGFMINFHFLCLIIPSPNKISEEEINLLAVFGSVHLKSRNSFCSPLLSLSL